MSYDGIVTRAVVNELRDKLLGGRVDKIYQHEKDELTITIYSKGINQKLLVSSSSNTPRLYLTRLAFKNPDTPPMFCMLLRKYLIGGHVLDIRQENLDRVVTITVSGTDELGHPLNRELVIEIMGKHSNIILIEESSKRIIDSIKRVPVDISRIRQILPGLTYHPIQNQDKRDPLNVSDTEFMDLIAKSNGNTQVFKFLYQSFTGLSPLIARAICQKSGLEPERTMASLLDKAISSLYDEFEKTMTRVRVGSFKPMIAKNEDTGTIDGFHSLFLDYFGTKGIIFYDSVSEMLDSVYSSKDIYDRLSQKSSSLRKLVQTRLEKAQNKLTKLREELLESSERDKYKTYADLIQSNLHRIKKGTSVALLQNYYDPRMEELSVPLDEKLGAVENAQRYYKKYSKLKTASLLLDNQISETEEEISYLEHVIMSLENSTEVYELEEIRNELAHEGYISITSKQGRKRKDVISKPLHFVSSDGFSIFVGRNNRQNEILTMKTAKKEDYWLHVKGIPGSHVIIRTEGRTLTDKTLEDAAILAAWYSRGRNSSNIEVDYTLRKNVWKPKNSKPGFVNYDNQSTIIVTPSISLINSIRKVEE